MEVIEVELMPDIKERKSSTEIITTLAKLMNSEPKTVYAIMNESEKLGETMRSDTIIRYVELIIHIQKVFQDKEVVLDETIVGNRTYRTIRIINKK